MFFYLASVVPAIWFLELHELSKRIDLKHGRKLNVTRVLNDSTTEDLRASIDSLGVSTLSDTGRRGQNRVHSLGVSALSIDSRVVSTLREKVSLATAQCWQLLLM